MITAQSAIDPWYNKHEPYLYTPRLTQNVNLSRANTIHQLHPGQASKAGWKGFPNEQTQLSLHSALDAKCKDKGLQTPYHHPRQTMFLPQSKIRYSSDLPRTRP